MTSSIAHTPEDSSCVCSHLICRPGFLALWGRSREMTLQTSGYGCIIETVIFTYFGFCNVLNSTKMRSFHVKPLLVEYCTRTPLLSNPSYNPPGHVPTFRWSPAKIVNWRNLEVGVLQIEVTFRIYLAFPRRALGHSPRFCFYLQTRCNIYIFKRRHGKINLDFQANQNKN